MPVIYCAINPFYYTVNIQIIDEKGPISYEVCHLDEIYAYVSKFADKYGANKVVLGGGKFGSGFAEEIQAEAAMEYGINNLEIEVI